MERQVFIAAAINMSAHVGHGMSIAVKEKPKSAVQIDTHAVSKFPASIETHALNPADFF